VSAQPRYLFDANAIINPFQARHSFSEDYTDRTPEIIDWFKAFLRSRGALIKEVIEEVKYPEKAHALVREAKDIPNVLLSPNNGVYDVLARLRTYVDQHYEKSQVDAFFKRPNGGDKADPWVLSYAKHYGLTIVTLESRAVPHRNGGSHRYEGKPLMPHLAWKMGISVIDLYSLMRETSFFFDGNTWSL